MHVYRCTLLFIMLLASLLAPSGLSAQSDIVIDDQGATIEFPNLLTFAARIESDAEIEQVIIEYGVDKLTCGTVTAQAFPDFEPGTTTDVAWTWEMRQSGSEPPGAQIWYRWRVVDAAGNEQVSDEERITWLDDQHTWRSTSQDMLTLHWYAGPDSFAEELLASAVTALEQLGETTGVVPQAPINMYIYGSSEDMREATLYEPGWTGGQAFIDHDIVIIGISPEQIEWGKDTIAHELTHVLVGHLTFSCLGSVPTWLNEGIAVYGEGGLDPGSANALDSAIAANQLFSLRSLSGGFSEHPDRANLSYSQSFSVVNYLIDEHGSEKLLDLFGTLRDGMPIEQGLIATYDFGLDELENRWRSAINVPSQQDADAEPTATVLPTPVPTYQPIAAVPAVASVVIQPTNPPATPTPERDDVAMTQPETAAPEVAAPEQGVAPWSNLLVISIVAFLTLLIIALVAVVALVYESRRRAKL